MLASVPQIQSSLLYTQIICFTDLPLTEFKFVNSVKYRGCCQLYSKTLLPIAFCMVFSSFLFQSGCLQGLFQKDWPLRMGVILLLAA